MNALLILTAATMLSQDKSIVGEDHVPTQIVLKQVGSVSFGDYAGWHVKYSEPHVSGLTTDKLASLVIPEGSIPGIEVDRTTVTLDNRYGQAIRNFSLYGPGPGSGSGKHGMLLTQTRVYATIDAAKKAFEDFLAPKNLAIAHPERFRSHHGVLPSGLTLGDDYAADIGTWFPTIEARIGRCTVSAGEPSEDWAQLESAVRAMLYRVSLDSSISFEKPETGLTTVLGRNIPYVKENGVRLVKLRDLRQLGIVANLNADGGIPEARVTFRGTVVQLRAFDTKALVNGKATALKVALFTYDHDLVVSLDWLLGAMKLA